MILPTLNTIKILILTFYLLVVVVVVVLTWLYLIRTVRVTKAIGLHAPEYIKVLVRISIANAIFTAFLIAFFLITKIY
jgi:hypothetical protein